MAQNFMNSGYEVFVWNRTKSVSESLLGDQPYNTRLLTICDTPRAVTEQADVIFEVTANDESSEAVWYGDNGILAGANKNKVLIVSATLSIDYTDKLIADAQSQEFTILDIPLTGGRIGAETGNMTLLCGGSEDLINSLKPTFEAIAANVFYFGPQGHGMRYKLILNFVQASHIIAFGQAMGIAKDQNMDLHTVADGLAFRPGGVITEIAKNTYFKDPEPITFSIEWITKDLEYAKRMAGDVDVSVLETVLEKYQAAIAQGMKDRDWAAINKDD